MCKIEEKAIKTLKSLVKSIKKQIRKPKKTPKNISSIKVDKKGIPNLSISLAKITLLGVKTSTWALGSQ